MEVFRVIKRVGDSNYILGDIATGKEVSTFKQPVHPYWIVPKKGDVLDHPIAESKELVIEHRILQYLAEEQVLVNARIRGESSNDLTKPIVSDDRGLPYSMKGFKQP